MIGIIPRTLVECLVDEGGEELRQAVFHRADLCGHHVFRMDENYSDEDLKRLIDASLAVTGLTPDALYDRFSRTFVRYIQTTFPAFLDMCATSEDLVRMQAKIHALIGAGMASQHERDATSDKFTVEDHSDHALTVRYCSGLQLCGLYKALARHFAKLYGDTLEIDTLACRKGDSGVGACRFRVRWLHLAEGGATAHATGDV